MFLVLSAKRFDFKNDAGEQVTGSSVTYLDVEGGSINEPNRRGVEPLTIAAPIEVFQQFDQVPGFYSLDFRQRPGKNGRPTLTLVGVKFDRAFSFSAAGGSLGASPLPQSVPPAATPSDPSRLGRG